MIWLYMLRYRVIILDRFWLSSFPQAVSVDILCTICCLQSKSAISKRLWSLLWTYRFVAAEQPRPQSSWL